MILQKTIQYIEENLFKNIDYEELAEVTYTNKYNVMRIFSAMTDYTIAEYVRYRRLTEAGRLLCETKNKIIDIGFDCGYSTPESFTKAFKNFNGYSPNECRKSKRYKIVPVWNCDNVEASNIQYEIKTLNDISMLGYGRRFYGKAENRGEQDKNFFVSTRKEQEALRLFRNKDDCDWWEVLDNFDEKGYDFYCTVISSTAEPDYDVLAFESKSENYDYEFSADVLRKIFVSLKRIQLSGKYAVFTSEKCDFPMKLLDGFTKKIYSGIGIYDFIRDEKRPELLKIHWERREKIKDRHLKIYIPIK